MQRLIFKKNKKTAKHNRLHSRIKRLLVDENCGFFIEDYFHTILNLEKKRTERSGKHFLLMLINIKKIYKKPVPNEIIATIGDAIISLTRETDIKGWYERNAFLGIIFTESNGTDKDILKNKFQNHLSGVLDEAQMAKIKISFHVFPEEGNGEGEKLSNNLDMKLYPDITKNSLSKKISFFIKRFFDVVGSIFLMIIFLPSFLLIPAFIKLTSEGPVLFKQKRHGQFGRTFTFLKFRSMYINNDPGIHKKYIKTFIHEQKSYDNLYGNESSTQKGIYKIKDDPRITPIGRLLRKTSLDELPQFINVLKGEMSLVGPRPPIHYELEDYDLWHRRRILEVKPGITGLWQVKGRSSTTFDEMVRLDLQYSREWSIWLDLKILLLTPFVVLTGRGAY
jgi:lipopolysaccharide/colanic/teichoic acid biosynthesis glycosyltransferase